MSSASRGTAVRRELLSKDTAFGAITVTATADGHAADDVSEL
jgi:hypothetical protein